MWQVVYIAPSGCVADHIKELLASQGFLVSLRAAGVTPSAVTAGGVGLIEVLVPKSEVEEAHEAIQELLSQGVPTATGGEPGPA